MANPANPISLTNIEAAPGLPKPEAGASPTAAGGTITFGPSQTPQFGTRSVGQLREFLKGAAETQPAPLASVVVEIHPGTNTTTHYKGLKSLPPALRKAA